MYCHQTSFQCGVQRPLIWRLLYWLAFPCGGGVGCYYRHFVTASAAAWLPEPQRILVLDGGVGPQRCPLSGTMRISSLAVKQHEERHRHYLEAKIADTASSLTSRIKHAYESEETDGILALAKRLSLDRDECMDDAQELLKCSIEAANNQKGKVAGMMNAWIGACLAQVQGSDDSLAAQASLRALNLLHALEDSEVSPDLVTYSLVYTILSTTRQSHDHDDDDDDGHEYRQAMAESVLRKAQKLSKKKGGSKRRKELAAARRRRGSATSSIFCKGAVEAQLQDLFGSDFCVLQETNDFVVLCKPSGLVCAHKRKTTAGKVKRLKQEDSSNNKKKKKETVTMSDISLVDALVRHNVPLSTLNAKGRGLVHRVDRGTSGCLVLAKTDEMHARLVSQFFLRSARKSYTAVVSDDSATRHQSDEGGTITSPVHGRPAWSVYSVLKRYDNGTAMLRIETRTGRKHQVRVHCASSLKSPILLDPIYGSNKKEPSSAAPPDGRFLLHASSLSIPDLDIDAQAPIPDWWQQAMMDNGHVDE